MPADRTNGATACKGCEAHLQELTATCPACGKPVDSITLLVLATQMVDARIQRAAMMPRLRDAFAGGSSITPAARAHFARSGPAGKIAALRAVQASGDSSEFPTAVLESYYKKSPADLRAEIIRTLSAAGSEASARVLQHIMQEEKDDRVRRVFEQRIDDTEVADITFPSLELAPTRPKPQPTTYEREVATMDGLPEPNAPVSLPPPSVLPPEPEARAGAGASPSDLDSVTEEISVVEPTTTPAGEEPVEEPEPAREPPPLPPAPPPLPTAKAASPPAAPPPVPPAAAPPPLPTPKAASPSAPPPLPGPDGFPVWDEVKPAWGVLPESPPPPQASPERMPPPELPARRAGSKWLGGCLMLVLGVVIGCAIGALATIGVLQLRSRAAPATQAGGKASVTEPVKEPSPPLPKPPDGPSGEKPTEKVQPVVPATAPVKLAFTATATSSHRKYPPENLTDGDPGTVWQEDKKKKAENQVLTLTLEKPAKVTRIGVMVGFDASDRQKGDLWPLNNRLKTAAIAFPDGTVQTVEFEDVKGMQWKEISSPGPVTGVTLTVVECYRGSWFRDNAIPEIEIWGVF